MVLFRHRAASYEEAMKTVRLFGSMSAMYHYLIAFHNLYNLEDTSQQQRLLTGNQKELRDKRNGWLHSHLIMLGNVPLGIFDNTTLTDIPLPKLSLEKDTDGSLKCQFTLLDKTYLFLLGMDQWSNSTRCLGFKITNMQQPLFRQDNVEVDYECFTHLLHEFIMNTALKSRQQ